MYSSSSQVKEKVGIKTLAEGEDVLKVENHQSNRTTFRKHQVT